MIAFEDMLVPVAKSTDMKVPEDLNNYDKNEFPQWHIFVCFQLGRPIVGGMISHWENAKIITKLTSEECKTVTISKLVELGCM